MWRRRVLPGLLGLAVVILLAWLRGSDPQAVRDLRDIAFDTYQQIKPREPDSGFVRIIDIDDASLDEIGQWPWPRNIMAELADRLTELGAASVTFDILFSRPDRTSPRLMAETLNEPMIAALNLPDYDSIFRDSLARTPSILAFAQTLSGETTLPLPKAGVAVVGTDPNLAVIEAVATTGPLQEFYDAAFGMGAIGLGADAVGAVRQVPLLWRVDGRLYPALSLEALRVALGAGGYYAFTDQLTPQFVTSVRVGDFEVPTDRTGALRVYYQETQPGLYISAREVLGDNWQSLAGQIAGNLVLIGTSAAGLQDIRGTALGTDMPGVEIHAQILQQILSNDYLYRADWVDGLEILGSSLLGILVVLIVLFSGPLISLALGGLIVVLGLGASWLAFANQGLLIDPSFPLVSSFIVYLVMILFQFFITNSDRRKIRTTFGHYVSPQLLVQIEKSGHRLELGGEMRELSILFTDIRSFTTLSEHLDPPGLVALLNTLFGALGASITEHSGTIDKFMGDAMMAFWNAPVDVPKHAYCACVAALGMRRTLDELNDADAFQLRANNRAMKEIAIGVGISTGRALVGNLGLETRFDYSCIGDSVNVASRVEGACKVVAYDILVVAETQAEARQLAFLEAGSIALKGKSNREPTFILVGDETFASSDAFRTLHAAHCDAVAALISGNGIDEAVDRCIALITFPDRRLSTFYETLRSRRGDFAPAMSEDAGDEVLEASGHSH